MSLELLKWVMIAPFGAFVVLFAVATTRWSRAVRGSHARYVASTVRVVAAVSAALCIFTVGVIDIMLGYPVAAGFQALLGVMYLRIAYNAYHDDDNWFNKQGKRLKRGLKRLRQRLANATPSPSPSPA